MPEPDQRFPEGFLWGGATSSHQIEGNNVQNDWWDWEKKGYTAECSEDACDSFNRYEEDFDLARQLNHNAHRFSIEWSRIQPREDFWDESAIQHYQNVVSALRSRNLEPVVTLHHFTNPRWMASKGGWENPKIVEYFERYCDRMVTALGSKVRYWVTINEPMVYVYHGCLIKYWPPGRSSLKAAFKTIAHFAQAHCRVYNMIHERYKRNAWRKPCVGLSHSIQVIEAHRKNSFRDRLAVGLRKSLNNRLFLKLIYHPMQYIPAMLMGTGGNKRCLDFIGLNYYFREIIVSSKRIKSLLDLTGEVCTSDRRALESERSDMDWEIYPEGIYRILMDLKPYSLPILITENGVCTEDDDVRIRFLKGHLGQVRRAIVEGVQVIGYHYWSLLDNFEWSFGFRPRFGLIHVDFKSKLRTIKPSGKYFAKICEKNSLAVD